MFELQKILPDPLMDHPLQSSQIWERNLKFIRGKKYLIKAPSGKGKSTFIHILYGLRSDFKGILRIGGHDSKNFESDSWAEMRQSRLSIVFQDLRLFPKLSAKENIVLNNFKEDKDLDEKILRYAKALSIQKILQEPCGSMSYGERQRVAIIRALIQDFEFLLLDEPFSHLDKSNIEKAKALISKVVSRQKSSMIFVSLGADYGIKFDKELIL